MRISYYFLTVVSAFALMAPVAGLGKSKDPSAPFVCESFSLIRKTLPNGRYIYGSCDAKANCTIIGSEKGYGSSMVNRAISNVYGKKTGLSTEVAKIEMAGGGFATATGAGLALLRRGFAKRLTGIALAGAGSIALYDGYRRYSFNQRRELLNQTIFKLPKMTTMELKNSQNSEGSQDGASVQTATAPPDRQVFKPGGCVDEEKHLLIAAVRIAGSVDPRSYEFKGIKKFGADHLPTLQDLKSKVPEIKRGQQ